MKYVMVTNDQHSITHHKSIQITILKRVVLKPTLHHTKHTFAKYAIEALNTGDKHTYYINMIKNAANIF